MGVKCSGEIAECLKCHYRDCVNSNPDRILGIRESLGEPEPMEKAFRRRQRRERKQADQVARRIRREKAGLCTKCGKRPPLPGVKYCQECREKQRASHRAWREKQNENRTTKI